MKRKIRIIGIMIPFLFFTNYGCEKPRLRCPDIYTINENIILIEDTEHQYSGIWLNDSTIHFAHMIIKTDDQFLTTSREYIPEMRGVQFLCLNPARTKLLGLIKGATNIIKEYNLETKTVSIVYSSTKPLVDALYYHDDENILLSSHEFQGMKVYLYNRTTDELKQIYIYTERVRSGADLSIGFDVHPTKNILLLPIAKEDHFLYLIEFNMDSGKTDSVFVFDQKSMDVWVRYNQKGDKILYSLYPSYLNGYCDIVIIDRNT